MTRHSELVYVRHMRDHAREAIEILGDIGRDEIESHRVVQLALLHLVEIIGEAAGRISPESRGKLSSIPWREVVSMRNRIIHGYDTIKISILWDTVAEDLPPLAASLEAYLQEMDRESQ